MNAFVVSDLIKRRAQPAGDIEKIHKSLRRMIIDLENLDATILQFELDFKIETIQLKAFRPCPSYGKRPSRLASRSGLPSTGEDQLAPRIDQPAQSACAQPRDCNPLLLCLTHGNGCRGYC